MNEFSNRTDVTHALMTDDSWAKNAALDLSSYGYQNVDLLSGSKGGQPR
jgi:hypothetical protein